MIIEIGGILVASAVALGVAVLASKGGKKAIKRDVLGDYAIIKSALIKFRKEKMGIVPEITDLEAYLEPEQKIDWKYYSLSSDEKFLVVLTEGVSEVHPILNQVGGDSYALSDKLFLSFNTLQAKKDDADFEPIAAFSVYPEHITTMTTVHYDTSACRAVDGEILEYKWEKALPLFDMPGEYVLKLKIRDKKGRWSKSAQKKITVIQEKGLASVAAGGTSLFVLHKDGRVDGQGINGYGQLGTGNITPYKDRVMIPTLYSVSQLEATDTHTVVLKVNGTVYAFGKNDFGQLGTGNKLDVKTPKEIWGLKNIKQIGAGEDFGAALDVAGKVYTWGDNTVGQLGSDRMGSKDMPMVIDELSEIKYISLGYRHAFAVRQDGTVYAWGDNDAGQLGLGFKSKQSEIMMTGLKKIDKAIAGKNFGLAIDQAGMVLGWGNNLKNQLGLLGQNEVMMPIEIKGLKDIVDIKTYGSYCIALDKYGKIFTWGQSNVLNDNYPEKPKLLDFLPLGKSIAIADRFAYLLTGDDRIIRWSGDSSNIEEMPLRDVSGQLDIQG